MSECVRIADQLHRASGGDAWHGPTLSALLADVTAVQAAAHPLDGAHSIWELVHHITIWRTVTCNRMDGLRTHPTGDADWPPVTDTSETAWQEAKATLQQSYETLHAHILHFPKDRLDEELVPGKPYSFYVMLHGVVQHDLYHAGQIALLKKVL